MREQQLKGDEAEVSGKKHITKVVLLTRFIIPLQLRKKIQEKAKDGTLVVNSSSNGDGSKSEIRKRGRWDQTVNATEVPAKKVALLPQAPTWEGGDVSYH